MTKSEIEAAELRQEMRRLQRRLNEITKPEPDHTKDWPRDPFINDYD